MSLWNPRTPETRRCQRDVQKLLVIRRRLARERSIQPPKGQKNISRKNNTTIEKSNFLTGMFLLSQNGWESQNWGIFKQIRHFFLRLDLPHRPADPRKKYPGNLAPLIKSEDKGPGPYANIKSWDIFVEV